MVRSRLMRGVGVVAIAAALAIGSGGCTKRTIDPAATGSVPVNGTDGSLMKFCDGTILIYWTPNVTVGESDDYEFIVYDGCTADGKIINGDNAQTRPPTEDLNQGEEDEPN